MRYTLISLFKLLIAGVLAVAIVACSRDAGPTDTPVSSPPTNTPASASEPPTVVASIYPMQYFAERIGGDRVEVVGLVPPGVEAHGFELTARDLLTISEADVIAMNGLELEQWLERALESLGDDISGIVVRAAYAEAALPFEEGGHGHEGEDDHGHEDEDDHGHEDEDDHGHEDEDDHGHEDEDDHGHEDEDDHGHEDEDDHGHEDEDDHGHEDEDDHGHEDEDDHGHEDEDDHGHEDEDDHGHGEFDPHFWLDPLRAITQAERIAEALIQADPAGADVYRANLAALSSELRALHAEFEAGLSSCVHREFVTSHSAYGYLALAYDLEQVGIAGLSPEAEPSPQRLALIADRIKELGIRAVLLEPVLSGDLERALASETGAGIYKIHAIESVTLDELAEHGDYFGLMRDNLKSLRAVMECS